MNEFLASVVSALNALIAICIIAIGVLVGIVALGQRDGALVALASIAGSVIAAVLVCGVLALFIDIRNSNREIVRLLQQHSAAQR